MFSARQSGLKRSLGRVSGSMKGVMSLKNALMRKGTFATRARPRRSGSK